MTDLIKREDAIIAIEWGVECTAEEWKKDGRALCAKKIRELPSVTPSRPTGHWIDIAEQKPDVGISVLVCDIEDDIYLTHLTRADRFFDDSGNCIKNIVAWMPLPKPYKAEKESAE